ncbi:XTP/dITP diphosphatase [bacterium]|nr:XTP/dITP diphosphatase [bacterium]
MKLIIATHNKHKVKELCEMLCDLDIAVTSLDDYPNIGEIIENGKTFEENAKIKVREISKHVKDQWILADDSGLCVDALNGEPGIYSARFAGMPISAEANNLKLLEVMRNIPDYKRSAHFVCVLVLIAPDSREWAVEGKCEGQIAQAPKGDGGFGYDPLFFIPEKKCTMAELSSEEKNKISHRGIALGKLTDLLIKLSQEEK